MEGVSRLLGLGEGKRGGKAKSGWRDVEKRRRGDKLRQKAVGS
jgi:hypothetical protein